jgi:hypothetical protein
VFVPLSATPGLVVSAAGAAWVVFFPDQRQRAVLRVVGTAPPEEVPLASVPGAIAPAADGVCVASHNPGALRKIC